MGTFQEASPWEPRSQVSGISRAHDTQRDTQRRRWQHSVRQSPPRVAWRDKNTKRGDPLHNGAAQRETCTSSQPPGPASFHEEGASWKLLAALQGEAPRSSRTPPAGWRSPRTNTFYSRKGVEVVLLLLQEVFRTFTRVQTVNTLPPLTAPNCEGKRETCRRGGRKLTSFSAGVNFRGLPRWQRRRRQLPLRGCRR